VIDHSGRFVTPTSTAGQLAVWDSAGRLIRTLGRAGAGPGELSALGALSIFTDGRGFLHIRDGSQRWSIFSADLAFVKSFPSAPIGGLPDVTLVLDDGTIVSSRWKGQLSREAFRIFSTAGELWRTIPVAAGRESGAILSDRVIAPSGTDRFWAASSAPNGQGYFLQLWRTNGELIRTLYRTGAKLATKPPAPPPRVSRLHVDASGLIIASVIVANADWTETARAGEASQSPSDRGLTPILEILDADSATLLLQAPMTVEHFRDIMPRGFISGHTMGYRPRQTIDDVPWMEVLSYRLAPLEPS
jgi:hypothetical protein